MTTPSEPTALYKRLIILIWRYSIAIILIFSIILLYFGRPEDHVFKELSFLIGIHLLGTLVFVLIYLVYEKEEKNLSSTNLSKEFNELHKAIKNQRLDRDIDFEVYLAIPTTVFFREADSHDEKVRNFHRVKNIARRICEKLETPDTEQKGLTCTFACRNIDYPTLKDNLSDFYRDVYTASRKAIDRSRLFVMVYPHRALATSCLFEAGYANKAGLRSLYLVDEYNSLPSILNAPKDHVVDTFIHEKPQLCSTLEAAIKTGDDQQISLVATMLAQQIQKLILYGRLLIES